MNIPIPDSLQTLYYIVRGSWIAQLALVVGVMMIVKMFLF